MRQFIQGMPYFFADSLTLFVCLFLESAEIKPQKLIFKPSILSDVAKNLATSSSKSLYTNIFLYLNFLTQKKLKIWITREKHLVVRYRFQARCWKMSACSTAPQPVPLIFSAAQKGLQLVFGLCWYTLCIYIVFFDIVFYVIVQLFLIWLMHNNCYCFLWCFSW